MARRGRRLSFVQIGANDGVTGDPIRRFILEFGWSGVLVEPQLEIFEAAAEELSGPTPASVRAMPHNRRLQWHGETSTRLRESEQHRCIRRHPGVV